jgi:hypothetical protein
MFSLERCETVEPTGGQCGGQALWVLQRVRGDWVPVCAACAEKLIDSGQASLMDLLGWTP